MRARLVMLLAVVALVGGACAGDDTDTAAEETEAPAATEAPEMTEAPADDGTADGDMADATVAVASSDLGDIVVDGEGVTLYAFLPDEGGEPTCTGGCVDNWPVFEGPAGAGEGADGALLGTVEHPSGVTQATYNDWPLYYFAADEGPGDTNGQGVGDNWYVVSPAGEPVTDGE